jgi:hypothetical protein
MGRGEDAQALCFASVTPTGAQELRNVFARARDIGETTPAVFFLLYLAAAGIFLRWVTLWSVARRTVKEG